MNALHETPDPRNPRPGAMDSLLRWRLQLEGLRQQLDAALPDSPESRRISEALVEAACALCDLHNEAIVDAGAGIDPEV